MKNKLLYLMAICFCLAVPLSAQTRSWTNVVYANQSTSHKLDIYLPATGHGPFPVIVMIHGGAFKSGDKSMEATTAKYMITKGYAVASINYRLSGEALFPAQIHDVKAAIRFLRANAGIYLLDPLKFATWGESAGGGLAALAGTSGGVTSLEDMSMGNSDQNSTVQAVVDLFGPINFLTMNGQWTILGVNGQDHDVASSPESALVGGAIQTKTDICNQYNPETYISSDDPPFYIQHGSADVLIPYLQSKSFADKLSPVIGSNQVSYMLISGAGHGTSQFFTNSNLDMLAAFLDTHLKNTSKVDESNNESQVKDFILSQNYPNPFNGRTVIEFELPASGLTSIRVFDIAGKRISTLLDEERSAGHHQIVFDAVDLASGIYYYQLKVGDYLKTRLFTLVK